MRRDRARLGARMTIGVLTGGGDCPGLNAVIRAVVLAALDRGWECYGIRDGLNGLLLSEQYVEGGLIRLTRDRVRGITHLGGTIIGTTQPNVRAEGGPKNTLVQLGPDGELQREAKWIRAMTLILIRLQEIPSRDPIRAVMEKQRAR